MNKRNKIFLGFGVAGLLVVLGLITAASYGRVTIHTPSLQEGQKVQVTLVSGDKTESKEVKNGGSFFHRKGTYYVALRNGTNNISKLISVKGFLNTEIVNEKLLDEQARTFVATNPSPCMTSIASIFYSISCGDGVANTQKQINATTSLPGYTETQANTLLSGNVIGFTSTDAANYVLIQNYIDEGSQTDLIKLSPDYTELARVTISESADLSTARLISGRDTVTIFSLEGQKMYQYSEITQKLSSIPVPTAPNGKDLQGIESNNRGNSFMFSTADQGDAIDNADVEARESTVIITKSDGSTPIALQFNDIVRRSVLCGDELLCNIGEEGMKVYSYTTQGEKKLVSTYPGFTDVVETFDGYRYVTDTGIYNLDLTLSIGFAEYSLNGYTYCGSQSVQGGYLVCVIDSKQQKHALLIDLSSKSKGDQIDKTILKLLTSSEISAVSALGNIIYVTPNYSDISTFSRNLDETKRVNESVANIIRKIPINTSLYTILNAGAL